MATKRSSYLKRLKEQKRTARAAEKRDVRRARREAKSVSPHSGESVLEEIPQTGAE
jgi:hypothetical protein